MQDTDVLTRPSLPKFATGLNPLRVSLGPARPRLRHDQLRHVEPRWERRFVAGTPCPERVRMTEFGYDPDELNRHGDTLDDTAIVEPVELLTPEGSAALARVCEALETYAAGSNFIISRRVRGADMLSPFVYNMLRDRDFLLRASRIVGVPLMPHPIREAVAQINYYRARVDGQREIAKWHTDGMDYVFTMLLTDPADFDGGQFVYYRGHRDTFSADAPGDRVRAARLAKVGDAIFARGSHIYHGVTDVRRGRRVTLTLSLFSAPFARSDSNSFMHVASDDGLAPTVPNWLRLKWPAANPVVDYAFRSGSPVVTWDDLADEPAVRARAA